ncbi:indolepyruvate oxidoreductase subunit beta [Caproiciproducens galactitolivorans]|uniref:Indolepyruvate ferredoxin oxidoreductase subunit beta n=1 Tax=Caproiciproducens galactitolivorans TaxID=642589 RepID=A0ABT4BU23_9FIRM|nr:indolepyruvate oxidoreductase subunit beta [Caproiciproducens galactitolivorans]MCY1714407.1 indolepyruvate oxidoreductase subunit beta [Caproiciproducens galactitolivorans]
MNQVKSVMIVGVGGQGTLLASRVLGSAMLSCGADVKVSEVHGMSQRGGSVVTYVRYGDKVYSPIIEKGEADILLAFEALEAARFLPWLKTDGTVVVNTQQIDPIPVVTGSAVYPENVIKSVQAQGAKVVAFNALKLAEQAGSVKAVNIVLIGAAAKRLSIDKQVWIDTIKATVPAKFVDMNLKAFELGYGAQESELGD